MHCRWSRSDNLHPACAAPLVFALLGTAAVGGADSAALSGFFSLGLFGLTLSLPLVCAVFAPAGRRLIDKLGALAARIPFWTGVVFVLLGLWSIYFGLFVSPEDWA